MTIAATIVFAVLMLSGLTLFVIKLVEEIKRLNKEFILAQQRIGAKIIHPITY